MRKTALALLIASAACQTNFGTSLGTGATPGLGAPAPLLGSSAPTTGTGTGSTTPTGPSTKGLVIGTVNGIQDSDVACAQGITSACGLPNIASIYNPNPAMRYQTQASDQALTLLTSTGRYTPTGQRVASGSPAWSTSTVDVPYWTAGGNVNVGGVYTTGTFSNTPITSQVNYLTSNPLAPNAYIPSASNANLPQSTAYGFANALPQLTTAPNALTSAGYGYSTALNTATSPVYGSPVSSLYSSPFYNPGSSYGYTGFPSLTYSTPSYLGSPSYSFSGSPSYSFSGSPSYSFSGSPSYSFSGSPSYSFSGSPSYGFSGFGSSTIPGTTLSTAPAFTNAYTQNVFGYAPAAGVPPQAGVGGF